MALDFGMKMEAIAQGVTGVTDEDLQALKMAEIDLSQPVSKPPTALFIGDLPLLSVGDFSCVVGLPKSRKTFLVSAMAGAYISDEGCLNMTAGEDKGNILWIDTEQSPHDARWVAIRVHRLAGLPTNHNDGRFRLLSFRGMKSNEDKMRLTEAAIKLYNPKLVIIDGIADLIDNVNDIDQSSKLENWLLETTQTLQIHIIGVLHLNPNASKGRGHLGSNVERKAQLVIRVVAEGDVSTVSFPLARHRAPTDFAFTVVDGLPVLTVPPPPTKLPKKAAGAFSKYTEQASKREMAEQLMDGYGVTKSTAYRWIEAALGDGLLTEPQTGFFRLATATADVAESCPF